VTFALMAVGRVLEVFVGLLEFFAHAVYFRLSSSSAYC
jgi:hypothetical protein